MLVRIFILTLIACCNNVHGEGAAVVQGLKQIPQISITVNQAPPQAPSSSSQTTGQANQSNDAFAAASLPMVPRPTASLVGRSKIKISDGVPFLQLIQDVRNWLAFYFKMAQSSDQDQEKQLLVIADAMIESRWGDSTDIDYSLYVKQIREEKEKDLADCLSNANPALKCDDQRGRCSQIHGLKLGIEERLQTVALSKLDDIVNNAMQFLNNSKYNGLKETIEPAVQRLLLWWARFVRWYNFWVQVDKTMGQTGCPR